MVRKSDPQAPALAPQVPELPKHVEASDFELPTGLDVTGFDGALAGSSDFWDDYAAGERIDHRDGMKLTDAQIAEFDREGYLFLPSTFSAEEIAVLKGELPGIFAQERDEVWREQDGKAVRTAFAAHHYNEAFRLLGHHPRMIEPVQQLLDGPVYIHQYKINAKAAFDGDVWQWHQDYGTWARDDQMPEARAMYRCFNDLDASIVEINPLVVTGDGDIIALDAKMNFDDNALFRHKNIAEMRDEDEEDPMELEAARHELNYIKLDGEIGCMEDPQRLLLDI